MWSNHSLNQYNHFQSNYQLFPNSNSTFVPSSSSVSASSSSSSTNPSSFLSNVLNQNFTVERLMNQYELDLESILQDQKDNDDYISSDDENENDGDKEKKKEKEKEKEKEEEREKKNFIIDGIVHMNVMLGENSMKKKESEEDEKLTVLKKRPIKKNKPFISFTEAEFLKKVLMIKKRISKLTKEYHLLNGSIDVTKREIEDLDLLKDKNDDFTPFLI